MAKKIKGSDAAQNASEKEIEDAAVVHPGNISDVPPVPVFFAPTEDEILFELYASRVANVDTVHTIRRDHRAIFADAFKEAQEAYEVFKDKMSEINRKD